MLLGLIIDQIIITIRNHIIIHIQPTIVIIIIIIHIITKKKTSKLMLEVFFSRSNFIYENFYTKFVDISIYIRLQYYLSHLLSLISV